MLKRVSDERDVLTRKCDKIVEEPRSAGANQGLPVVSQNELVRDVSLDSSSAIEDTVQHADSEVED